MNSKDFAEHLKNLRKKAGFTQEVLAKLINFSLKTVQRWEKGEQHPRTNELKKLAKALNVTEEELLNGEKITDWVLTVKISQSYKEVIELGKVVSTITTSKEGGFLSLGGGYELWTDDNQFKKLINDLKKLRATVIQNGIALGGIKD